MAVNNSLQKASQKRLGIGAYLTGDAVKARINQVVGGKDGQRFISAIVSAVQTNPALQECTNQSILSAALLGESLKLSPSPMLGNYYLVPFNNKVKHKDANGREVEETVKEAQFQLGYKGYIQLAIRSGQYKKLNVMSIKKGELESFDPLNEEIKVNLMVDDWDARESAETIGYYAFFELVNGFSKAIYWSKKQMENHALKYSQGYKRDVQKHTAYSYWAKDFDGMAYKTLLRQLLSKWGVLSIDLQNAFEADMSVINDDGTKTYVDNVETVPETVIEAEAIPVDESTGEVIEQVAEPVKQADANADDIQQALFN